MCGDQGLNSYVMIAWPPPHKIRHSSRAKRISLRITAADGLEVIVPKRQEIEAGLVFLNEHRQWVEKQVKKMTWVFDAPVDEKMPLPDQIELKAINQRVDIVYHPIDTAKSVTVRVQGSRLVFYGLIDDFTVCVPFITHFLKKQAKLHLSRLISDYAKAYQLPFNKLSIRAQKTRWGSCNANCDIQLNYKLLFLPIELVHYVLLHELCHTKHLNHSNRFWKMLEGIMPDYRTYVRALRDADQWVPRWLK